MSMEVRPGYKKTEVGIFPEDWELFCLSELAELTSSKRIFENDYVPTGVPFYRGKEISLLVSQKTIDDPQFISEKKFNEIKKKFGAPEAGDILITAVGTLGNIYVVNNNIPFYFKDGNLIWLRKINSSDSNYIGAQLEKNKSKILDGAIGSSQKALTIVVLKKLQIPVAPLLEQRAIAGALSDMDRLISSLDQLIAKKRDIQQASMQQLLTGQRRLPGFSGKWLAVKARDIGLFRGGSGFPNRFQGETSGAFPFYKVSDMNNEGNEIFMSTANNYIAEDVRKAIGAVIFPANSIVFAKVGAAVFLERKKILTTPSCLDNNMAAFIVDERRVCVRFMHYSLLNIRLGDLVSTTALPSLSNPVLSSIEITLPPISEQQAIATILSDIDAELATLETRRDKALRLKLGMMQELLTGRIRLT